MFCLQAYDAADNSKPFIVIILIQVVNDNPPTLFVGGENVTEYTAVFLEGQDYLGGPVLVPVALLRIFDPDSGNNTLVSAVVEITDGMHLVCCSVYSSL